MSFKSILINAPTQAMKTQYFLNLIDDKYKTVKNTLMVFFTQSNSLVAVDQIKNRMSNHVAFSEIFTNCYPSAHFEELIGIVNDDDAENGNYAIVDFWNIRNVRNIFNLFAECPVIWDNVIIVIDEAEQASTSGVYNRLQFVKDLDDEFVDCFINLDLIMITATVPNLSKAMFTLYQKYDYSRTIIKDLLMQDITEYHYVKPHESYVGPSWFLENNRHIEIKIQPKSPGMSAERYRDYKIDTTMEEIHKLPQNAKRLSLVVLSTRKADHTTIAEQLLRIGYNVVIELNSENCKNYNIRYLKESSGSIRTWQLPFTLLQRLADDGKMSMHRGKESGIKNKHDLSLPEILASACFMGTEYEDTLISGIQKEQVVKLQAIFRRLESDRDDERPDDFPTNPFVAIVTGHMAGRGISFQDARINFVCSSFAFLDVNDSAQRGANNAQRFGRSCGILLDVYKKNMPVLIATKNIVMNAIANEKLLYEKAYLYENGTLVSLKDLITESDWRRMKKSVRDDLVKQDGDGVIDGVKIKNLIKYMAEDNQTVVAKIVKALYQEQKPVLVETLINMISYTEGDTMFESNIKSGLGKRTKFGKLWDYKDGFVSINPNITKVIDSFKSL